MLTSVLPDCSDPEASWCRASEIFTCTLAPLFCVHSSPHSAYANIRNCSLVTVSYTFKTRKESLQIRFSKEPVWGKIPLSYIIPSAATSVYLEAEPRNYFYFQMGRYWNVITTIISQFGKKRKKSIPKVKQCFESVSID
jgi:hypothetical protein